MAQLYAIVSMTVTQNRWREHGYLVNGCWTRLKSVEHSYPWFFIRVVESDLLIMFIFCVDWLLSKDHIQRKPFWVCDNNQQTVTGAIA